MSDVYPMPDAYPLAIDRPEGHPSSVRTSARSG